MKTNLETLAGHAISGLFTRARRTDTTEVREAIARGDFADARWLRCEAQLALIAEGESREDRRRFRSFIVTSSAMFDMGDQIVQFRPRGSKVPHGLARARARATEGAGMIGSFVFGVMFALGCVALVRRAPKIERALVEAGPDPDRVLDLMTWNDRENTYALHDGRSRLDPFRPCGRLQRRPHAMRTEPDPDALASDRRIARWNHDVERLDTSELMALLVDAFDGVKARGP